MALAQGSGELIWWPYIIAKYGLAFLFLLIPACLLQYPVNYEIGRYTLLTGESIFQGFFRLHRRLAIFLWILMTISFLWFGAFASAGGTALAALTHIPAGWSVRGQTYFWSYFSIGVFLIALLVSRHVYRLIEKAMMIVAGVTFVGLVVACCHPTVIEVLPSFLKGLFVPPALSQPFDFADSTKLLTAFAFAGLGGFWTLFYSYWLREKGVGMAAYQSRYQDRNSREHIVPAPGALPQEDHFLRNNYCRWRRFLLVDSGIGIFGNLLTTLMTCLLAFAVLFPQKLYPEAYQIAVVQSEFFRLMWGPLGGLLFLLVAAAFLADTWLATVDALSRAQTDIVYHVFPQSRKKGVSWWYTFFILAFTVITGTTLCFEAPGPLILLSAVIGFAGTVLFTGALLRLNHYFLKRQLPPMCRPTKMSGYLLWVAFVVYLVLAVGYCVARFLV